MRSAAVGGLSWNGASSSSSSSSSSGSSSTHVPSKQQSSSCVSSRTVRVHAVSLQYQLPKDPPSAYHALRQQSAHSNSSNSSSSHQYNQPGRKQQQQHWPRPVDDVCKAVSKRLKQAQDTAAVLRVVEHHAGHFNAINTALAYAQLARHLRFETDSSRAAALQHSDYATLQGLAVQQAGQLNPRQISMVLTSLAWMQCPAQDGCAADPAANQQQIAPPQAAAPAASNAASRASSSGGANGNGNYSADSGAVCLQQQQALLLDLLSQRLLSLLDAFEPEDTCHCLWALTKMGALQEQLLAAVTEHGLTAGWLHMLTAKPLSSLLWVHAQAHLQHTQQHAQLQGSTQAHVVLQPCSTATAFLQDVQDLPAHQMVAAVMQEVSQPGFLSTWTPQELSMLLWSCAVLGVPVKQQQPPQQQSLNPQQDRLQQQGSGSSVHRHGALPAELPVAVLQEVCQLARQHVVQFSPQGVAMVCWSLSHLLTSSGSASEPSRGPQQQQLHPSAPSAQPQQLQQAVAALFDAFTAAAVVRLQYYKPQEVCNIFTACTRLQLLPAGLTQSVEGYVSTHAHLLGCRDVTELLLAAAQTPQGPWQQHVGPGQQQGMVGLGPVAVRALLHRTGQLVQELNSFQVAAAAWACVRLAQLQDAAARRASTSSRGGNLSGGSSALQEECMGMASVLLTALGAPSQQTATGSDCSGTVGGAGRSSETLHGQEVAAAWSSMAGEGAGDIKQIVALAWATAATSNGQHMLAAGADMDLRQPQHSTLLGTVLQQLQRGVQSCDSAALVQVLCVLGRLCPVVLHSAAGTRGLGHAPAEADMQRVLLEIRDAAVTRLLPLVSRLTSADAATAGWAAAKLYVLLRGVQHSSALQQQPAANSTSPAAAAAPAALLSEVLTQLHLRQQLAALSGQSVSSLLWSCRALGWVPPAAVYLELLGAADARLLQLQQHQQVSVLQSVTAGIAAGLVNPQAAGGVASPADAALAQQLHRQTVRLVSGLTEQLHMQLHQQALQLDWQLRNPAGVSAAAPDCGLAPQGLITLVVACGSLKILQGSQLLHQVVEVWQMLLQQGAVSVDHSLLMLWHLADVLHDSPTKQWHTQVLQQQVTQSATDRPGLLPWLLHHAVNALAADLAAYSPSRPQQGLTPQTLVLALRVFSKLRYQPPGQVLGPLMQQLQSALPVLAEPEIVSALAAAAQLAVPAPSFTAAAVKELARKQLSRRTHPAADAQQGALQQQELRVNQVGRPAGDSLTLLWAVLASGACSGQGGRGVDKSTGRLLVKLAHKVAGVPGQQLLQRPEMLLMQQQAWRMLRRMQLYAAVRKVLHYCGLPLPRKLLSPRQLDSATQVLLPRSIGAHAAQQALLQLLFAGQQQQRAVLQQHLHVLQQSGQRQQPEQLRLVLQLLPAWLQYQLQKRGQQQLAQQFVRAQLAAGFAAATAKLKVTPSGEVVLVLVPQQHRHTTQQQRKQQFRWLKQLHRQHRLGQQQPPSDSHVGTMAASNGSCKGVAVVLEVPSDVSVNTGRVLGRGLARDALLQAEGYHVMRLPVQDWLPDFVLRHQHNTQLQEYQDQPMRQQHVQKLIWKRLNKLRALRRRQVGQLMEALYLCSPTCSSSSS